MTGRGPCGSERVYEVLLTAYPRSFRRAMGPEMVRLVGDRRIHGREPLWLLWPSLLRDTARNALIIRVENLMTTHRALVIGALTTLTILAALSSGPVAALPFLAVLGVLGYAMRRRDRPVVSSTPSHAWRRWLPIGVALFVVSFGYFLTVSDDELSGSQWAFVFFGSLIGLFATSTGVALLVGSRRRPLVR
jgi:hypothetical protein